MDSPTWQQVNISFPDWTRAEHTALKHLAPTVFAAEDDGAITAWFHIRKRPCWRLRYLPSTDAGSQIGRLLDVLTTAGHITGWTPIVYEPEIHAFGGTEAMETAHRFFHHDSRGLLTYLRDGDQAAGGHRREISLLLCSALMRAADLDWYEQGDVWARVAAHRPLPVGRRSTARQRTAVQRLITVDADFQTCENALLARTREWARAYTTAGHELSSLTAAGALHRGLRDVLAHHVIFAWNRLGLPYATQAALAATAKDVVFGPNPTTYDKASPATTSAGAPDPAQSRR
ncbi:thiopeptide-type bacteriocin biosynthesis protein [Streptomyces jumonjinensis]|uniref:Methyltransferase n=1 Tax=Streptomyces jumonjinensis TaxID=1945 RepID=A0A646KR54_STRJU|nr:thiopeptide-type bacteriocin biosynthesis protein [Streptomyces jumonjinensis]MQT04809.1 methyltransferase [Streptomyces jumonjinensis]